jgi:hypothetical protein
MESEAHVSDMHQQLVRSWGVPPPGLQPLGREALLEELARRVDHMIRHDFDRLMSSLYILDVPEAKFSAALERPAGERPARLLAELILDREIERMHTWQRYAKKAIENGAESSFHRS